MTARSWRNEGESHDRAWQIERRALQLMEAGGDWLVAVAQAIREFDERAAGRSRAARPPGRSGADGGAPRARRRLAPGKQVCTAAVRAQGPIEAGAGAVAVQRKATATAPTADDQDAAARLRIAQHSAGAPLPAELRAEFARSLGIDPGVLDAIRVHVGPAASAAAVAIAADAFTIGRNIYFASGAYQPETAAGRRLIAHEVSHAVAAPASEADVAAGADEYRISAPDEAGEHAADRIADAFASAPSPAAEQGAAASSSATADGGVAADAVAATKGAVAAAPDAAASALRAPDGRETLASLEASLGPGQALDGDVAGRVAQALGVDVSTVRVHRGPLAARKAADAGALAFAVGSNIVLAADAPAAGTPEGDALLAHELIHLAQQRTAADDPAARRRPIGAEAAEAEAEAATATAAALAALGPSAAQHAGASARAGDGLAALTSRIDAGKQTGLQLQRCDRGGAPAPTPATRASQDPTMATTHGPDLLSRGESRWDVLFALPTAPATTGYIIQEITYTQTVTGAVTTNQTYHFWEAFKVRAGSTTTIYNSTGYDDTFRSPASPANTRGSNIFVGKLKFYEGPLPADFQPYNPRTIAGELPSSTTAPPYWGGSGVTHNNDIHWDNTGGNDTGTLRAVAGTTVINQTYP